MSTEADARWMARAIALARRGHYGTSPNPRVGCVLVRDEQLLGEGWHQRAGEGHAEVNALAAVNDPRGATAYVSLEPCSHHGKTPPCAEALVNAGVARVVIAMQDPNPQVVGNGIQRLRDAGIEVDVGLMQAEAEALNPGFIKRMKTGLPRVRAKLAMSLDGRTAMASGESQWITGSAARADVQRLRAESCAVLSGVETVLRDNAALNVRPDEITGVDEPIWRQPLRVVLDSQLRLPADSRFMQVQGPVLVATATDDESRAQALRDAGAEVIVLPGAEGRVDLHALMQDLAALQCNEVLVEAGATVSGSVLRAGLLDGLIVYMAPTLLGSEARPLLELPLQAMAEQQRLVIQSTRAVGTDWRIDALVEKG